MSNLQETIVVTIEPQELLAYYRGRVDSLELERVSVEKAFINKNTGVVLLHICGGLNGKGNWSGYLDQIKTIVSHFNGWVIKLENDVLDDVWYLQIGYKINEKLWNQNSVKFL